MATAYMDVYQIVDGRRRIFPIAKFEWHVRVGFVRCSVLLCRNNGAELFRRHSGQLSKPISPNTAAFIYTLALGIDPAVCLPIICRQFEGDNKRQAVEWWESVRNPNPNEQLRTALSGSDELTKHRDAETWGLTDNQIVLISGFLLKHCKPRNLSTEVDYRPAETIPEDYYA